MGLADRLLPSVAELLFTQGLNHRTNTTGLRIPEVFQTASQQGIVVSVFPMNADGKTKPKKPHYPSRKKGLAANDLPAIVEQDAWNYQIQRYQNETVTSKSMVCCVFVCAMWKVGLLL